MNVFSCLRNSSWPSLSCCYQMNGIDICLGYTNLQGILGSKWTIRYESISDILISRFSGINKCSQGRKIFVIDFGSSRYQIFIISLICISAEVPAYSDQHRTLVCSARAFGPSGRWTWGVLVVPSDCCRGCIPSRLLVGGGARALGIGQSASHACVQHLGLSTLWTGKGRGCNWWPSIAIVIAVYCGCGHWWVAARSFHTISIAHFCTMLGFSLDAGGQ